jgi:hypothetical protein
MVEEKKDIKPEEEAEYAYSKEFVAYCNIDA